MIIEFMAQNHLYLINNSSKPTYLSSCGESIIDLTLCNYNLFKNVNEWKVEDIETNSDHCYITYSITFDTQTSRTQNTHHIDYYPLKRMNKKLCFKKANWNQFKDLLIENLVKIDCEIRTKIELENAVKSVTDILHEIMDTTIPSNKFFKKSVHLVDRRN